MLLMLLWSVAAYAQATYTWSGVNSTQGAFL